MKKMQKEKALLNTAFELFLKNGIKNTAISDITERAGVAKGTFYLYFKDKFDIRDKLVASKASGVYAKAYRALQKSPVKDAGIEERILFLIENSVDQLCANKPLMHFISMNLDWAVLKNAIVTKEGEETKSVIDAYHALLTETENHYRDVEVMLFMIIELTNATCYNVALFESPTTIEKLKPDLFQTIRLIMKNFEARSDE